jgi:GT2 family glycosyltransferase
MKPTCWIVTPTLDRAVGERTIEQSVATAGLHVKTFVAVDHKREGGVRTANRALAAAIDTPFVCYINDDVSFPNKDWLVQLIDALKLDSRNGIAGPTGGCGTVPQCRGRAGMPYGVRPIIYLSFFCAVFRRELLDKIGLLDERFIHYGCDNDYCLRTIEAGFRPVYAQHVWVEHKKSPRIRKWKDHDVVAFRGKWGGQTGNVATRIQKEYPDAFK